MSCAQSLMWDKSFQLEPHPVLWSILTECDTVQGIIATLTTILIHRLTPVDSESPLREQSLVLLCAAELKFQSVTIHTT